MQKVVSAPAARFHPPHTHKQPTHTQHTPSDCAPVRLLVRGSTLSYRKVCVLLCARSPARPLSDAQCAVIFFGHRILEFRAGKSVRRPNPVVCLDDAVTVRAKMQMMSRHHFAQLFRNCSIYLLLLLLMISEHKVCVF